jgi:hypothetical protein
MQAIQRFLVANKHKVLFVGAMIALDDEENLKEGTGAMFAYGDKEELRDLLNDLRDAVEDKANHKGFVNF